MYNMHLPLTLVSGSSTVSGNKSMGVRNFEKLAAEKIENRIYEKLANIPKVEQK